jgi:hypothetical protein
MRAGLNPAHKGTPFTGHPIASKWRITGRNRRAIATSRPKYHADLCQGR